MTGTPTSAESEQPAAASPPRRTFERVRAVVVAVVGTIGLACVLAWAAAALAGLSFVVVTTGSMAPTIPAGGIAVTHRADAADLAPGDVVTVPRPGSDLPVTHRVVSVDRVPGDETARSLTLRGDDNGTDDRDPYVVREAGLVLVHAPHLGSVLVALTSPAARGAAVAAFGALVVWAFWPSRQREER